MVFHSTCAASPRVAFPQMSKGARSMPHKSPEYSAFCVYAKPIGDAIELLPRFNGRIWDGAADKHHLLFVGPMSGLVTDLEGFTGGCA